MGGAIWHRKVERYSRQPRPQRVDWPIGGQYHPHPTAKQQSTELFKQRGLKLTEKLRTRDVENSLLKRRLTECGTHRLGQL